MHPYEDMTHLQVNFVEKRATKKGLVSRICGHIVVVFMPNTDEADSLSVTK